METLTRSLHAVLVVLLYFSFSNSQTGIPDGAASLVFVFDTTGSMYDDLVQVRAGASKILSTTLERKVKPLYNYVLIPFHDPGKSGLFSVLINDSFLSRVSAPDVTRNFYFTLIMLAGVWC